MVKVKKIRNEAIIIFLVIGLLAIGAVFLYFVSQFFNPLFLLIVVPAWIVYMVSKQYIKRRFSLNRFGYFGGGREREAIVYEEIVNGKLLKLKIKLENTEPGHWELFVPTESEWRLSVPEWATHRRDEIIERIRPYFNNRDIHLPDDNKTG